MLYGDLEERGLIYQQTTDKMADVLGKPQTFYVGIDPTSDSLHIGSMLPLMTSRRLQQAGHKPILVMGGATGMIGDPSGKSEERNLLTKETIDHNVACIKKICEKFVDFSGDNAATIVNNADWMDKFSYVDFLRDVGKHFTINYMMGKDSVKGRLENREQGISYTEFSYMLLQAYDFFHLHKNSDCKLQIGGSDQWGNITAGIELIRRMQGESEDKEVAWGFTWPLVTKSDGGKFGKTEKGNIWLSPDKTSPYQFYQFILRLGDEDIKKMVSYFSLKPLDEVKALLAQNEAAPHERAAQKALAAELTTLVHGESELKRVEHASQVLFSGKLNELDKNTILEVFSEAPSVQVAKTEIASSTLIDVLVKSGLCQSKGAARKDVKAGAIYLNNERVENKSDEDMPGKDIPLLYDSLLVVRKGKKNYCLVNFV